VRTTSFRLSISCLALILAACTSGGENIVGEGGAGGQSSPVSGGGTPGSGGVSSGGGTTASGGVTGTGGTTASGGSTTSGRGGAAGGGGTRATGGTEASGGATSTGGSAGGGSGGQAGGGSGGDGSTGGTTAAGGRGGSGTGGATIPGSGGRTNPGTGGRTGTGGAAAGGAATGGAATGGSTSTGTGTSTVDCNATMPTGGTDHCGSNTQGNAGGQAWSLWCNQLSGSACITTFNATAFSARWNNNSDFLARVGLEFGNAGKKYDQYGTLKADLAFTKNGSGGGYSYIGIYGWTNNPCVEWYIVDDKFGTMPFNAYNATQKGTATIDGESYKLFQNKTNGTGGSRCSGVSQWDQYWSIRQKARQCGTITISEHFKAWEAAGLNMAGNLLEAKILVETGGSSGSIDFPIAKVTAQ